MTAYTDYSYSVFSLRVPKYCAEFVKVSRPFEMVTKICLLKTF